MACLTEPPADVIVFLLDDMRADQLEALPETLSRLSDQSVQSCPPGRQAFAFAAI